MQFWAAMAGALLTATAQPMPRIKTNRRDWKPFGDTVTLMKHTQIGRTECVGDFLTYDDCRRHGAARDFGGVFAE